MTKFVSALLLIFLMASLSELSHGGGEGSLEPKECPGACAHRCSKAENSKGECLLYCNICCSKCLCVPSGTYGHKEECPCYNNWKTKKGTPKCP